VTSLLGRLVRLFPESVPLEDLFTEAVVRLFETNPRLCLEWLQEVGLLSSDAAKVGEGYVSVWSQKRLSPREHHDTASRIDALIEVRWPPKEGVVEDEGAGVVMIESKIGSKEGPEQLRRYAEHLDGMAGFSTRTLLYITRGYDPKDPSEVLSGLDNKVRFEQLRWHDFYRFLRRAEKDALIEEVMAFMEEQGMASSYRFSVPDLMALSGMPRGFEILDETLGGEVKAELESFVGHQSMRESHSLKEVRWFKRYLTRAQLHGLDLFCDVGYQMGKVEESTPASIVRIPADGYPAGFVALEAQPGAKGREASIAAMKRIALNEGWETYNTDDPTGWAGVRRVRSLASLLPYEDHVAAVKHFFVESIQQLREELTEFKKRHPDLPWTGG
jgi:hypothetical protein